MGFSKNSACVLESHQVLAQLLDTLLIIGTQLPDKIAVIQRLIDVACKVIVITKISSIPITLKSYFLAVTMVDIDLISFLAVLYHSESEILSQLLNI